MALPMDSGGEMEIRIDKDKRECGIAAADKAEEVLEKDPGEQGAGLLCGGHRGLPV